MNERILELAKQCASEDHLAIYGGNYAKFAELIIKDCVSQIAMIGVSNFENDDVSWTVDKCIENIRTHFGVEK